MKLFVHSVMLAACLLLGQGCKSKTGAAPAAKAAAPVKATKAAKGSHGPIVEPPEKNTVKPAPGKADKYEPVNTYNAVLQWAENKMPEEEMRRKLKDGIKKGIHTEPLIATPDQLKKLESLGIKAGFIKYLQTLEFKK